MTKPSIPQYQTSPSSDSNEATHADPNGSTGNSPPSSGRVQEDPDVLAFAAKLAGASEAERRGLMNRASFLALRQASGESLEASSGKDEDGFKTELVGYDTIKPLRTDWLWKGRIPRGMFTLLPGSEGLGKSAATLRIAADLTHGRLAGDLEDQPADIALVTVEDDPARTIRPRLEAAGADLQRVKQVQLSKDGISAGLILPRDAQRLARKLGEADIRLVIIDPLVATLDPKLNSYKDQDVREAFGPLVVAAAEHDFAVLGILHTNKGNSDDPRQRAIGSIAFQQLVRSVLYVGVDPDDPEGKHGSSRVIAHEKCNVGPLMRGVRFKLVEARVAIENRQAKMVRAEFGGETNHRASDLLRAEAGSSADSAAHKSNTAFAMLYELLEDGPKAVKVLQAAADERGIGWRTVEQAKKEIGIESNRLPGSTAWAWHLPKSGIPF